MRKLLAGYWRMGNVARVVLAAAMLAAFTRCTDPRDLPQPVVTRDSVTLRGLFISDPQPLAQPGLPGGPFAAARAEQEVAYLSLAPGTLPEATRVEIVNLTSPSTPTLVPVIEGGFDPVGIEASADDTLRLTPSKSGTPGDPVMIKVPNRRPPSIVRVKPPRGRTDVAMSVIVTVIFTEPMTSSGITSSSVTLIGAGVRVPGRAVLADGSWDLRFVPDEPLRPNTDYELLITRDLRDSQGDPIDASYTTTFRTGTRECDEADGLGCESGPGQSGSISGTLSVRSADGLRPMPNGRLQPYIQRTDRTGYFGPVIMTDDGGRFSIDGLPKGIIQFLAIVPGYDQPCGVAVPIDGSHATADVEIVFGRSPLPDAPRAPPSLWGGVWERIRAGNDGSAPVAGARLQYESLKGVVAATTTTDSEGRFMMCRLPWLGSDLLESPNLFVSKAGYQTLELFANGRGDLDVRFVLDLIRLTP
jgi:hypothetical protein